MSDSSGFAKLVPGFDFLQSLVKTAGGGLPAMGQWIAPTLDPEELEKRIRDLRTVQFWLEQNGKMIGATIQALEVQRMTLSTLKSMNLPVDAVRETLKIKPEAAPEAPAPAPTQKPSAARADAEAAGAAPAVDPMQWWGALTQQFSELASRAIKELPASVVPAAAKVKASASKPAVRPAARPAAKAAPKKAAAPRRRTG